MNNKIMTQQESMIPNLLKFYLNQDNFNLFKRIIDKTERKKIKTNKKDINNTGNIQNIIISKKIPKISLSLISWFCINYSKQYDIEYFITKNKKKELFNVYMEYLRESGSHQSKEYFDFFARGEENGKTFNLEYKDKEDNKLKNIKTTIAQMNCFKWLILNDIIKYIENNIVQIYDDMKKRGSNKKNDSTTKIKKRQISENSTNKLKYYNINVLLSTLDKKK